MQSAVTCLKIWTSEVQEHFINDCGMCHCFCCMACTASIFCYCVLGGGSRYGQTYDTVSFQTTFESSDIDRYSDWRRLVLTENWESSAVLVSLCFLHNLHSRHTWPSIIFCCRSYHLEFASGSAPRSRLYRKHFQTVAEDISYRAALVWTAR